MTNKGFEPGDTTAKTRRRFAFSGIEQRVHARLRAAKLLRKGPVTVGFSGGPDSLCLAGILSRIKRAEELDVLLVHVNHRVRASADEDAERAMDLAAALHLPIQVISLDPDLRQKHPGSGLEEAMRRERYLMLAACATAHGSSVISTAHHQSDQVETVLLHLFRGAGLKGLAGMSEVSDVEIPWWSTTQGSSTTFTLWRPLLREPKPVIDQYVDALGLVPIIDESNADPTFRRNAIRQRVMPAIDEVYPSGRDGIARFAEIASVEDRFLHTLATEAFERGVQADGSLTASVLANEAPAIQPRVIRIWLGQWQREEAVTFERVSAIQRMAVNRVLGRVIEIGLNDVVSLIGDHLVVGTGEEIGDAAWNRFAGPRCFLDEPVAFSLTPGNTRIVAGFRFEIFLDSSDARRERSLRLPRRLEGARVEVRRVVPGDRFIGGKDVDEWLRIHRVPVLIRSKIVCLAGDGEVLGIPGLPVPGRLEVAADEVSLVVRWEPLSDG